LEGDLDQQRPQLKKIYCKSQKVFAVVPERGIVLIA